MNIEIVKMLVMTNIQLHVRIVKFVKQLLKLKKTVKILMIIVQDLVIGLKLDPGTTPFQILR